jgi:hypothetical protein
MRAMEFFYIQVQWQSVRLDDQPSSKGCSLEIVKTLAFCMVSLRKILFLTK